MKNSFPKKKSPRNKTLTIDPNEISILKKRIIQFPSEKPFDDDSIFLDNRSRISLEKITNQILHADLFDILPSLPNAFADLIIVDPPYNLGKNFHGHNFKARSNTEYKTYIESWLPAVIACAKPQASIYICCDWKSSSAIFCVLEQHCVVQNRITWQREKGRKSLKNWKNCSEDIWFATMKKDYFFNAQDVLHKKRVLAPYKEKGKPKDWWSSSDGKFRLTGASNFWNDITVPYWSMKENTDHPTQKPEKLLAKLILASSRKGDLVFDPFAGSGSTAVTAQKLGRNFITIEKNHNYCLWASKRLIEAKADTRIQGYSDGAFLPRNA